MHRIVHPTTPSVGEHKMLIAMALLAVMYCLGVPMAANLLAHFGS